MTKLKGILLTEGMHGMISQVEGLAKALDLDFTHHTVELSNFWKLLPPKLTPISQKVFKKINTEEDPVRPHLSNDFRRGFGRKIFGVKYQGEVHAVMCFACTNKIPKSEEE